MTATRRRHLRLLNQALTSLELDLSGARLLTEAATGAYAATPVMGALAGGIVHAISRDSRDASAAQGVEEVRELAALAALRDDAIRFHADRSSLPHDLDIIANSGHVRPVDRELIDRLGRFGAVSAMFEAWELRPGEIDLAACRDRGVPVAGVCEDFEDLRVFSSCGALAVKQCFEAGLEVTGNTIVVVSHDAFGDVIAGALRRNGADVIAVPSAGALEIDSIRLADALIVADYRAEDPVLGGARGPSPAAIARANPDLVIVQFVGPVDVASISAAGLRLHPGRQLSARQMAATLDRLGPRPAIFLNAAGLKVGELLWRQRRFKRPFGRFESLVQTIDVTR